MRRKVLGVLGLATSGWLALAPAGPDSERAPPATTEEAEPAPHRRRLDLSPVGQRAAPIGMPEEAPRKGRVQTLYDDGFFWKGEDDELRIGGWAQVDLRAFAGSHPGSDTFLVRRARFDMRGVLEYDWGYRLQGNLVGERNGILHEAWVEYRRFSTIRARVGQIKEPFSLESSMSVRWIDFAERASVVTAVEPAQDIGAMLYGTVLDHRVDYGVGVFNGQGRNRPAFGDSFETAARLVVNAWRRGTTPAAGLFVGGSVGHAEGERDVADLRLHTYGGTPFLAVEPGVTRRGPLTRWGAEIELVEGPFSLRGEYVGAELSGFREGGREADLRIHGGYGTMSVVVTGEQAPRNGPIRPRHALEGSTRGPGAFRLAARYQATRTDEDLLERELARGTPFVQSTTLGLDWFPNVHIRVLATYDFAWFAGRAPFRAQALTREHALTLRTQFNF